ncbi:dihydrofolate reductase [Labilibaculum sp. A4]|uniref:Dihydrofolate reductase n=1 Tax=Labilibaculum euxinus TaxID=2686357 RepID=A0A425YD78_9BACT|nr:dihydrofolate reductase [Labilibaculum euxinus]MDQ1769918.1 dihydrofolate reductase [Labilibaculum euxinus]MUP37902.1 dihydrofolate reductase [Labilibaculum euxinus]MVB07107.1 dihydrofolate reductase [Labilibaculum euxinus]MWN76473.1 dihydrofolate reductase [Labilibaculum euxinus]
MNVSIIVAVSRNQVIGKDNQLIWKLSADLKRFKALTTGHTIIMGRKTFESIGKPLPNRTSVIITRQADYVAEGCVVVNSLEEALEKFSDQEEVFIIGGGTIYQEALAKANKIYYTKVHKDFEGDTFFPVLDLKEWKSVNREDCFPDEKNEVPYSFIDYIRK